MGDVPSFNEAATEADHTQYPVINTLLWRSESHWFDLLLGHQTILKIWVPEVCLGKQRAARAGDSIPTSNAVAAAPRRH